MSLRAMLGEVVGRHPERPAITYPLPNRSWRTLTWHELGRLVVDLAETLDVAVGPARTVAVLADTDARYPILELAVGLAGRALQPLYVSATDDELRRALETTGAEVLVVGRTQSARARAGRLAARIVELDAAVGLPGLGGAPHAALPPDVEPFDTHVVRARLDALPARAPDAPLLYLQSTGTTGPARVIEIGEPALVNAVGAVEREASHRFPRFLSFLPTAHVSERLLTLYASLALAGHTWYGGGPETLAQDLRSCRPTVLLAPPLLLEALRAEAVAGARSTAAGRRLLASVDATAGALLRSGVVGGAGRRLGARLFGRMLRRKAGLDQVRDAVAGTAPLPASLHAWYEAVGIPLRDVYGQTELTGATSIAPRRGATFGAVGAPVAGVEIRISDDGELCVRAPSAFTRYVGDPAATARVLDSGWLRTGDRARLLATGEIVIAGRVQSLVRAPDGTVVDLAAITAELRGALGNATVVFAPAAPDGGVVLYAAPVPAADARSNHFAELIERADPHRAVRGWALGEEAFGQTTGEVGPTGKPRGWRIHELRAARLRRRLIAHRPIADSAVNGPTDKFRSSGSGPRGSSQEGTISLPKRN